MKRIKFYWYKSEYNFGDILNTLLFRDFFCVPFEYSKASSADCVAIGSILGQLLTNKFGLGRRLRKIFMGPVKIWGSGFSRPDPTGCAVMMRKLDVRAVRGRISLERLQQYTGKSLENVVLGDPGLLAARLLKGQKIEKKYELGIIPHYVDAGNPLLENIQVDNSILIDVTQPVEKTLLQIAQCRHIISSAMHGLIVADSFGIPNVRMVLSDKIVGGDYKFRDYYSAFDMELPKKIIMSPEIKIIDTKFIREQYRVPREKVQEICKELIRVFPYK